MHAEKKILDKFCSRLAKLGIDVFSLAQDEAKWITVHPGGKGRRADGDGQKGGTHVMIDSETGQILGGMGGKHNGKTIAEVKQETKEKKLTQKQVAAISAKEQQKAYGKGFHDGQKAGEASQTQTQQHSKAFIDLCKNVIEAGEAHKKLLKGEITNKEYGEILKQQVALAESLSDEETVAFEMLSAKEIKELAGKASGQQTAPNVDDLNQKLDELQKKYNEKYQEWKNTNKTPEEHEKAGEELKEIQKEYLKTKKEIQHLSFKPLQDKTETVLALPPTPENKETISKQIHEVQKGKNDLVSAGLYSSPEYKKLDEQLKMLNDHWAKAAQAEQSSSNSLQDKTDAALALPPTPENKSAIYNQLSAVANKLQEMGKNGDTQSKEYNDVEKQLQSLKYHAMKLETSLEALSGTDNLLYKANNVLSMPASKDNVDIIGKQYYDVSIAAKKLKDKGLENTEEYKSLKEMSHKLFDHWDNAQYNSAAQSSEEEYSPQIQQTAKLFLDTQKASSDFMGGKINKKQLDDIDAKYMASFDKMTAEEKEKFKNMNVKSINAAAAMFGTGVAGGTQTQTYAEFKDTPEGKKGIDELNSIGLQKISVEKQLKNLQKQISYNAGEQPPANIDELSKQYNKVQSQYNELVMKEYEKQTELINAKKQWEATHKPQQNAKYSPTIQEMAKAFTDYWDSQKEGKLPFTEIMKKQIAAKELYNKASKEDQEKWISMPSKEIYEAAGKPAGIVSTYMNGKNAATTSTKTTTSSKPSAHPMPTASDPEYTTPVGELSPVPQSIAWNTGSPYLNSLKGHNFPTTDNPTGTKKTGVHAKQGFTQAAIPTQPDMVSRGFYGDGQPPSGYWDGVPHVKNAHPDLEPLNGQSLDVPDDVKKAMLKGSIPDSYRKSAHNNVPYAAAFGTASGRAAAYAYTVKSYSLDRILRGKAEYDDMEYAGDAAQVTKELDKMLSVSRAKEPMVVYRGIHGMGEKNFFNEYKLGAVIEDKGFMSTSIDANVSSGFAGSGYGLFKILVPKGASAMSLRYQANGKTFSGFPHEDEILLPRNTKYRVVGFEKGTGSLSQYKKIPIVEIIP